MKVVTVAQMRDIEQAAIEEYGIPGIVLMENAGVEVVKQIENVLGSIHNKRISVFAGTGNNGGDGYVVARHLYNQGAKVKVFLIGSKASVVGDALTNLQIITYMGIDVLEVTNSHDWDKVKIAMTFTDCLVDALLGTGFTGQLRENMTQVVESINKMNKVTIAIDVPTGVDADTGQIQSVAVKASHTITFALAKQGLLLYPAASYVGELCVADIGIPRLLLSDSQIQQNLITSNDAREIFSKRQPDVHKGSCGKVLVVAGSKGLTGAAALASDAAMRCGAGMVTLGIAESLHEIMEIKLTEVMTSPLPEVGDGFVGEDAFDEIVTLSLKNDVVAIGPGLGRQTETLDLVRQVVKSIEKPLVLDADALYALIDHTSILLEAKSMPVLTPHPGEMARLVGLTTEEVNQDRIYIARQAATEWGSIVILKGARTVVAFPDGEVYINSSGNAGMATAGAGDVLTGVITGLIGQGLSSHEAALAGVYLHGLAGDIVARGGMIGMVASDLIKALPAAIFGIQEKD
ncbi:bifunctional ADP-dependent NAD(P)H-hydrate dehydratase/NAD(P)H-hydrate epimerase [Pelosinus sp. UFO1]|uniref:bifunctional ADP-dependent NAD(P)H-hydrate dehydratase/NAD(P)H-hydrate epimerase n=1 Tax=Pelosinus sp. UFO1 TaxID=484770 RepID=UPI0004D0C050|nr:bifunctional ADP-dependent NAD(P)H-hydrate dehydratase/NAD(P)H-hydrate epimerase [Pelosinus sp. UFO1]AIF50810.1 ADP/ATP-dependent (S)-NAD(P)H-hydrate dehydratase [Pelosinus sp. UFO1]